MSGDVNVESPTKYLYIYDISISLGKMCREACKPICLCVFIAKFTHVTATSKVCLFEGKDRAQARIEALYLHLQYVEPSDHAEGWWVCVDQVDYDLQ